MDSHFAMIPLDAIADNRLTLRMLKTFAAICSFRKSSDDFCVEAGRDEIASRCGFNPSIVSAATTDLQRLGWLIKCGVGGRAQGGCGLKTTYTITVPETVSTSGTVTEVGTVLESGTVTKSATVAESVSNTVSTSGTPLYKKEVNRDTSSSVPDGFTEFWDAYAKKVGKKPALYQWRRLKPDAALVRLIVMAAKRCASSSEPRFRKDPERWLEDRRWEDEIPFSGPETTKPEAGATRQRFGVTERHDETLGWVPA